MFKYVSRMGDRTFSVGIVPAPVSPALEGHPLAELSRSHFLLDDNKVSLRWAEALLSATKEQIEAARLQFGFLSRNIEHEMFDRWFNFSYSGSHGARRLIRDEAPDTDPADLAQRLFDACLSDARETLKVLDRNPRKKEAARDLQATISFLAEGREFFRLLATARGTEADAARAKRNEEAYGDFLRDVTAFKDGAGPNYANTVAIIQPFELTEAAARADLKGKGAACPERLTQRDIVEMEYAAGDYDTLWSMGGSPERIAEAIGKGHHRLLSDKETEELRTKAHKVIRIQADTFARGGFVGTLRAVSAAAHHRADHLASRGDANLEGEIRLGRKGLYDSAEQHEARIKEYLARVPQDRASYRLEGTNNRKIAVTLDDLLESVDQVLRPDLDRHATVAFHERADGTWVGEVGNSDDILVIYDDAGCGGFDKAVFAVLMKKDHLDDLPPLDTVKSVCWVDSDSRILGTNYKSIQEVFSELASDRDSSYFFSRPVRVTFAEPVQEPANAPGM